MLLCRACMSNNEVLEPLFNIEEEYGRLLSDMFTSCTSLVVNRNDGLPVYLCESCVRKVKDWYKFKDMALKSNIKLCEKFLKSLRENSLNANHKSGNKDNNNEHIKDDDEKVSISPIFVVLIDNDEGMNNDNDVNGVDNIKFELDIDEQKVVSNDVEMENYFDNGDHTYAGSKDGCESSIKNYYHCRWCFDIFTDFKDLDAHILDAHREMVAQCDLCGERFPSNKKLQEHIPNCEERSQEIAQSELPSPSKSSKPPKPPKPPKQPKIPKAKKPPKKCAHCPRMFTSMWSLKMHMRTHTGERPYQCHICGLCFSQIQHLKTHYVTHTGIKDYICEVCGKKYSTKWTLTAHMRYHRNKMHKCTYCPKSFLNNGQLQAHIRVHTGERPFSCSICFKSFRLKCLLKKHEEVHAKSENNTNLPYSCETCNRSFKRLTTFEIHTATAHNSENQKRTFTCEVCNKTLQSQPALKIHMIRHSANRPFGCTLCNRNFKDEATLVAHINFHRRPKPFQCETCQRRFIDRSALRVHYRTHTGEKPFECEICSKRFSVKKALLGHARVHTGERPFVCSLCNATFTQRSSLLTHRLLKHNGES